MSAKCCLTPPTCRSDVAKIQQSLKASESSGPHYLKYQEIQPGLQSWSLWAERPLEWSATQLWTQNPPAGSVCSQPIYISQLMRYRTHLVETKIIQQEHKWSCEPQKEAALRWPRRHFHWQWLRWRPSVPRPIRPHQMWGWSQAPMNEKHIFISFETVGNNLSVLLS